MMKTRISKLYRGSVHVGWKKTVGGREWTLGFGITASDEARAIRLAECLEARWKLAKAAGATELTRTDFDDVRALVDGGPRWSDEALRRQGHTPPDYTQMARSPAGPPTPADTPSPATAPLSLLAPPVTAAPSPLPQTWVHAAIDRFVAHIRSQLKPDGSNEDNVDNVCDRILRARELIEDVPLEKLRRWELENWLVAVKNATSKTTGKKLAPATVRNLAGAIRMLLGKLIEWELWQAPPAWETAFKTYSIKALMTPEERRKAKKKPPRHTVTEKRVLWKLADAFGRAVIALADWAGHTQKEIATLRLREIHTTDGQMYIVRHRHKTGVPGRWWIPPEPAEAILKVVARTPTDPARNPKGLAFLTPRGKPLISRRATGKRRKNDYIGSKIWRSLLLAAGHYGVRRITFKYCRKSTAQLIRNKYGKEVSRTFLAHADEDVQDESYTRPSAKKVEKAARWLYERKFKAIYQPIGKEDWGPVLAQLQAEKERREQRAQAREGLGHHQNPNEERSNS